MPECAWCACAHAGAWKGSTESRRHVAAPGCFDGADFYDIRQIGLRGVRWWCESSVSELESPFSEIRRLRRYVNGYFEIDIGVSHLRRGGGGFFQKSGARAMRSVVEVLVSQIRARKPLFLSSKVAVACGARDKKWPSLSLARGTSDGSFSINLGAQKQPPFMPKTLGNAVPTDGSNYGSELPPPPISSTTFRFTPQSPDSILHGGDLWESLGGLSLQRIPSLLLTRFDLSGRRRDLLRQWMLDGHRVWGFIPARVSINYPTLGVDYPKLFLKSP
uniref:Uncharacterized protein n=1 Tax=Fagus sylvatica TaxID=28930 RepID=A0A2N9F9D0_FAGSY